MSLCLCWQKRYTRRLLVTVFIIIVLENMLLLMRIEEFRLRQRSAGDTYNLSVRLILPDLRKQAMEQMAGNVTQRQQPKAYEIRVEEKAKKMKKGGDGVAYVVQQGGEKKGASNLASAKYTQPKPTIGLLPEAEYFKRRSTKVNPFKHNFIIEGSEICTPKTEMMIIIHSFHTYKDRRDAIRTTWGSIARTTYNPNGKASISLAFIFGVHAQTVWNTKLYNESVKFNDIIQGDFGEAYNNMTLKSLLGLKWMMINCPNAKFLLKSDDDMLINMPHLLNILHKENMTRAIMGPYNLGSRVYRTGKWAIRKDVYPYAFWPPYESGSAYIFSGDIIKDLFETAEYVPPFHIDDVYITGVLGKIIDVRHVLVPGFAYWNSKRPGPCDMLLNKLVTGTKMTPVILLNLWKMMHTMTVETCVKKDAQPAANLVKQPPTSQPVAKPATTTPRGKHRHMQDGRVVPV